MKIYTYDFVTKTLKWTRVLHMNDFCAEDALDEDVRTKNGWMKYKLYVWNALETLTIYLVRNMYRGNCPYKYSKLNCELYKTNFLTESCKDKATEANTRKIL